MSISQAIDGAKTELAKVQGFQRVQRLAVYARIFAAEIFGTVLAAPYGLRAFSLHRSLPDARRRCVGGTVSILRDIRFGSRPRNIMDIYLPPNVEFSGYLDQEKIQQEGSSAGIDGSAASSNSAGNGNSTAPGSGKGGSAEGVPMVLFCHGGVWASGSKWHYAPLATRLAQAGVITAVMQYTLYPEALVPQMVAEVSQALTWTFDHAVELGGSPQRVSLVGHSAGAQMCTMALLHRALAASKAAERRLQPGTPSEQARQQAPVSTKPDARASGEAAAYDDYRMPHQLVGMAGVYDIAKHYEYEEARHVHKLSTMERACGSPHLFPQNSPAIILGNALRRCHQLQRRHSSWSTLQADPRELLQEAGVEPIGDRWSRAATSTSDGAGAQQATPGGPICTLVQPAGQWKQQVQQDQGQPVQELEGGAPSSRQWQGCEVAAVRYYQSFDLAGEAIARRIGFDRAACAQASGAAGAGGPGGGGMIQTAAVPAPVVALQAEVDASGEVEGGGIMQLSVEAARRLPPTVLTSSCSDVTVPWYESAEQYWMLRDCGVPAKHLVYNQVSHGDFVTSWAALPRISGQPATDEADLLPHAADLVKVVSGRVAINFS